MKRTKIVGIIILTFLLLTPFIASSASAAITGPPEITSITLSNPVNSGYYVVAFDSASVAGANGIWVNSGASASTAELTGALATINTSQPGTAAVTPAGMFGMSRSYGTMLLSLVDGGAGNYTQTVAALQALGDNLPTNTNTDMFGDSGPVNVNNIDLSQALPAETVVTFTVAMNGNVPHMVAVMSGDAPTVTYDGTNTLTLKTKITGQTTTYAGNTFQSLLGFMILTDLSFGTTPLRIIAHTNHWVGDMFPLMPGLDEYSAVLSGGGVIASTGAKAGLTIYGPSGNDRMFTLFFPDSSLSAIFGTGATAAQLAAYVSEGSEGNGYYAEQDNTTATIATNVNNFNTTGTLATINYTFASPKDIALGIPMSADEQAIRTRFEDASDAWNIKDIDTFMSFFSSNYLNDGKDWAALKAGETEEFADSGFSPDSYTSLTVSVDGSTATTNVIWSDGETETIHWIKEGDFWMMYGNQKKYGVDAWSQNWHNGTQYMVHFKVEDPNHTATFVTITGSGITEGTSLSLDWDTNENKWNSWHTNKSLNFGSSPLTPPLTYTFTIVDSSETNAYTYTVQSFVSVVAINLSTSGAGTAADPLVFSWTGVGSGYTYQVQLEGADNNRIWDSDWGLTGTSVSYDGDSLTPDAQYHYWVVVADQYGNESFADGSFTYQSTQTVAAPGDVNGDTNVALTDAILALQVAAGLNPTGINLGADVNSDGKIGLAEVIYILQTVAGLRQDFTSLGIWNGTIYDSSIGGSGTIVDWELKQDHTMIGNWTFNPGDGVVISLGIVGEYSYSNNQISFTTTGTATMSGTGSGTSDYTLTVQGSLTSDTEASGTYSINFTDSYWTDNTGNWSVTKVQ